MPRRKLFSLTLLAVLAVGLSLLLPHADVSEPGLAAPVAKVSAQPEKAGTPSPQSAPVMEKSNGALAAFDRWAAEYVAATPEQRRALVHRGIALAAARRGELKALIATDPRRAIERAVPPTVRQQLPLAVAERLEERVNERAFFGVLGALPGAGSEVGPAIRREVRTGDGGHYRAFTFGRRQAQQTTPDASIVGVAVDDFLAVDERPLRVVEPGEIPNHPNNLTRQRRITEQDAAGFVSGKNLSLTASPREVLETCPVSGKSSPAPEAGGAVAAEQPVVEAEGKFHFLCSGGHISAFADGITAREGANGGPRRPTAGPSFTQSTGWRTHLLMRVAFPEAARQSVSEKEGETLGKGVQDWFVDSSYGAMTFMTTVTPLLILPRTEAWYKDADTSGSAYEVLADARAAATAAGFDPYVFDFDTVIYTGSPGNFSGQAYVGWRGCWLKSGASVGVATHEYGHNFGLWHANFWNTSGASIIGSGSHVEYGDSFDTMGSANAGDLQFNACHKNLLDWLPDALVHEPRGVNGTYRIYQMDQPRLEPGLRYALKITKDSDREYWVDLRQKFSTNRWVQNGVFLHWSPWTASEGGTHLLDTTPGSADDKTDAPLVIGRTFSDFESGIHITPIAKNATTPPSVDVVANFGFFPGNHAPALGLAADFTTAAVGATVSFTATATDSDGDTLSYHWDFGDKNFDAGNSPLVSKSWAAAGDYLVRCVVSDMKGGTASESVVVRVGAPTTFNISGTVTFSGQPLAGVRMHNGQTGTSYRGGFTDSDGNYVITGLAAGSVTVGASLHGYTLAPVGSATVSVGPDASGVDFSATATPTLSIAVQDGDCAEPSNAGSFRITRTGSTASALTVRVANAVGSATRYSDYNISPSPNYADPYYTQTIAAGQASVDVTITPVNDSTAEGLETVLMELLPVSGYVLAASSATLTIADDESALPVVTLQVADGDAAEPGDAGQFIVSRTGDTSAELNVILEKSGTATEGSDYVSIPATLTIPAGQSSVAVHVTPLADAAVEGLETVTLTVSTDASYLRPSSSIGYTGTINLTDANMPVVTVVAADATATEGGNDPGVFVVTRTGDTSAPLLVDYGTTGSALHGTDFVALPGRLTIPAGQTSGSVVITPIDDTIGEPQQTVRLYLRGGTLYNVGTPGDATVNLNDNTDLPYVTIGNVGQAKEPGTAGSFRITTSGTGTGNITLRYNVTGTATSGVDFTALPGTLVIGKNTTGTLTITPLADTDVEGYESVTVTLTPDPTYALALDASSTMQIEDDDLPVVSVSTTDDYFSENDASIAKFFISRTGAITATLDVNYTISGTATAGSDFTAPSGMVTIPANKTGTYVDVAILDDALAEGTETITLDLAPGAYSYGFATATRYLLDAESPAATVQFAAATSSAAENAGTATVAVTLSEAQAGEVRVDYALDGGSALGGGLDYTLAPQTLIFAPGETSRDIVVSLTDDTLSEDNETLEIRLLNPTASRLVSPTLHTLTITDNDALPTPTVGFATTTSSASEAVGSAPLFLVLSNPQTVPVSVDFSVTGGTATSDVDYSIAAGTITFAPGETARALPNTITDDALQELSETVLLTLSNPSAGFALSGNATHTLTIADDDTITLSVTASDAAAAEPANHGAFTITRTGNVTTPFTANITIGGTATGGTDYTAIGATVDFATGVAAVVVPVTVLDDTLGEANETVTLTLAAGAYTISSPSTATVTITEDEPTVTVSSSDTTATELGQTTGNIILTRTGPTTAPLPLDATISGTASNGADYAAIATPLVIPAGSATLTLTITPEDDTAPEGNETVVVTLNVAAGYRVGSPSTATVTIADDDVNTPPTVVLDSPGVAAVVLPEGVGLILETTVGDDGKPAGGNLTTAWSKLSGPGSVTFSAASLPDSTATFSTPGAYVLRLTASDSVLTTSLDVTVTVLPAALNWTSTEINAPTPAGSTSESGGSWTITGGGANITGTSDQCRLVHTPLYGNGEIRARVVSLTGSNTSAKAGVMLRAATTGNSRMASMTLYNPTNTSDDTLFRYRTTDGASAASSSTDGPLFPYWVRLRRVGNSISAFQSADGATWTQVGTTQTITFGNPVMAGLVVTGGAAATSATAVFDNVSVTFSPTNLAPFVDAGPATTATLPQPAALDGTATDDGLPGALILSWEKISGPGGVTFADSTTADTTAAFGAAGNYTLRLTASDGQVKTFDETAATTTAPVLTLSATAHAAEAGLTPGAFTFTRTGSADFGLTARFTTGSTATADSDFAAPGTSLVIPIGSSSGVLQITPLADAIAEGAETVVATLTDDDAYTLGAQTSASVIIADLPADQWRFDLFGTFANDALISGDAADPDGDGQSNLFEYLANTAPLDRASALQLGALTLDGTGFHATFTAYPDRTYTIQRATEISGTWSNIQTVPAAPTTRTIELTDPATNTQQFYRIVPSVP